MTHDCTVGAVGNCGESLVGIGYKVDGDEALHFHRVGVPVPAVAAVGHHENHLEAVSHFTEVFDVGNIVGMVSGIAVENVNGGETFVAYAVGHYGSHVFIAVEEVCLDRVFECSEGLRSEPCQSRDQG